MFAFKSDKNRCSFLSPKCKIGSSKIEGTGVFASEEIKKGELVAVWGGVVCTMPEIEKLAKKNPKALTHPITIYNDLYLVPFSFKALEKSDHFNHCCEPNAGVKGQIILVARKNIKKNEEICFDYETTEIGIMDGLPFKCECGKKSCRKMITGNAWEKPAFRKKNKGFFSWYIEDMILKNSKKKNKK